ncbi:trypsin-like serine protease [Acidicapsa dinghuensis]|uniref:Trypsin-like serine protease n=1 Tax=Acidicapsa dinghuensis TaxID=2218256 RepID=A0ABW1EGY2_9BACT|nr:trypsin-like serine protease [Acidicapsa dinghuensis]
MKSSRYFLLALLGVAITAHAIVIRHDVPDAKYAVSGKDFPALVDLPGEGHGVLIAKQWVVTAAHATMDMQTTHNYVVINGKRREVSKIVRYPDYMAFSITWSKLFRDVKSVDAESWLARHASARASMHDIALLELTNPVEDVVPVALYRRLDEQGQVAKIYGKGATGNDLQGADPKAPTRGALRRAYNQVISTDNQLLVYRFDCGAKALPLEGVIGGGDSGGPVLLNDHGAWKLAGVAHGLDAQKADYFTMHSDTYRQGICGQDFSNARISFFASWIDSVIGNAR